MARYLVGCSTSNLLWNVAGAHWTTAAKCLAEVEANCGPQQIHRDYAGSSFTTFDAPQRRVDYDAATQTSFRTTMVSWRPDWAKLAAGDAAEVQRNTAWLDSIPAWHRVILTPDHEADEYQGLQSYGTDYRLFREGFRRLADMIHARGNPAWRVCLLLTAYAWKANAGASRDPENFWPGDGYVDVMGIDAYNEGSLDGTRWDSPGSSYGYPMDDAEAAVMQSRYGGYRYGGFLPWCEAKGITRYVVGETGCHRNIGNVPTPSWCVPLGIQATKGDWIKEVGRFHSAYSDDPGHRAKCLGISYFMGAGRRYAGPNAGGASHTKAQSPGAMGYYYVKDGDTIPKAWDFYTESWELFWQSGYAAWADVTARYGLT